MRTAIVGAGRMGMRHVEVTRSLGLELVGLCDANEATLASVAQQGVPAALHFRDVGEMLAQAKPRCVIIATTAPGHAPLTCLAAESGASHILCEKPLAVSLTEADRMIQLCRQRGVKLAVNHQMRFMEQYTQPKRIVTSEGFGGLGSITVVAGNFGMAMNGTHYIEMFRYLTDQPAVAAQAWFSAEAVPNPRGPQFEDRAGALRLTNAAGQRFYMEISADQGHGMQVTYAGRCGRLTVDELTGQMHLAQRKPEHRALPTTRYGMPWDESTMKITPADSVAPTRAVLEALLQGKDYPTGEDGRAAIAALIAGYVSHESDHVPVPIDEATLPVDRVFPWA